MRRERLAALCGHLVNAGALILKLLLKTINLALKTQYMLLLGSQSVIQCLHRVFHKRNLRLQRRDVTH
jgi:hypothetical protein